MKAVLLAAFVVLVGFLWANGYIHPQTQVCADAVERDIASAFAQTTDGSRWGICLPGLVISPPSDSPASVPPRSSGASPAALPFAAITAVPAAMPPPAAPPPGTPGWVGPTQGSLPALPQAGVQIIYGGQPLAQAAQIEAFVQALVQGGYLAPESAEGYQGATYLGAVAWANTPVMPSTPTAVGQVLHAGTLAYLADYMGTADLDRGTWGQTVYLIIPTDGADWLAGTGGDCGYHGDRQPGQGTGEIVFAVAPEPSGGCDSADSHMSSWTELISHELLEAVARPYSDRGIGTGWGEPADACGAQPPVWYGHWQVVQYDVGGTCTSGSYQGT